MGAHYYRPRQEEKRDEDGRRQLSLYDLTEDEESPRKPVPSSSTSRWTPISDILPVLRQAPPSSSTTALVAATTTIVPNILNPTTTTDEDAIEDDVEDEDDDVVLPNPSPRRRVSFSTSSARSRSPDLRSGYLPPGSSLVAALGPKPKRLSVTPAPAPAPTMAVGKGAGTLPTPPLEDSPPATATSVGVPRTPERQGVSLPVGSERVGTQEPQRTETGHRRTRSRPTLLDLLSVPGPLRSPSPPVGKLSVSVATKGGEGVQTKEEKDGGMTMRDEGERMLPTPELTPTDEAPKGRVADVVMVPVAEELVEVESEVEVEGDMEVGVEEMKVRTALSLPYVC